MNAPEFRRTSCACADCRSCCERQPGYLIWDDVAAIREYLDGEPVEGFLVASPGAIVGRMTPSGQMEVFRVGSIVPRTTNAEGRCVFLDDEGRCSIHTVAPYGCAMFDTHMREGDWEERADWGIHQLMDPRYQAFRATLPAASTHNPTRER